MRREEVGRNSVVFHLVKNEVNGVLTDDGASPSGKAPGSGPGIGGSNPSAPAIRLVPINRNSLMVVDQVLFWMCHEKVEWP